MYACVCVCVWCRGCEGLGNVGNVWGLGNMVVLASAGVCGVFGS